MSTEEADAYVAYIMRRHEVAPTAWAILHGTAALAWLLAMTSDDPAITDAYARYALAAPTHDPVGILSAQPAP